MASSSDFACRPRSIRLAREMVAGRAARDQGASRFGAQAAGLAGVCHQSVIRQSWLLVVVASDAAALICAVPGGPLPKLGELFCRVEGGGQLGLLGARVGVDLVAVVGDELREADGDDGGRGEADEAAGHDREGRRGECRDGS